MSLLAGDLRLGDIVVDPDDGVQGAVAEVTLNDVGISWDDTSDISHYPKSQMYAIDIVRRFLYNHDLGDIE